MASRKRSQKYALWLSWCVLELKKKKKSHEKGVFKECDGEMRKDVVIVVVVHVVPSYGDTTRRVARATKTPKR